MILDPLRNAGYVYLAGFPNHSECYKIGSSKDPYSRMLSLSKDHDDAMLLVAGYSTDAIRSERKVQWSLGKFSNRYNIWCANAREKKYIGSIKSQEFFNFKKEELAAVIDTMSVHAVICYKDLRLKEWIENGVVL